MSEHRTIISLGSNINPEVNIKKALKGMAIVGRIIRKSSFIYTKPLLYENQPKFLNGAILLATEHDRDALRDQLKTLESTIGRIRTPNKNGPRAIDLDIIVFDGKIVDNDYYERDFLRKMVAELE